MKPRKYTPSKRVRNHIAKWEASDFAGQNAAFGGDAVGAKAIELMDMLGDKANAFTDNELDGLLSTYYNLSPRGFKKTLMPYIDAYAADLSDVNKKGLDLAMRDRWRIAAKKYQKGIRRRANADADLMGLSYQDPIVEQPDVIKRTNMVVPEENTEPTWKGAENVSPYVTGKPIIKLQPRLKLPPIEELMEDSAWEPSFRLNPRGYKNGKSPEVVITPDQEYNQYLNTLPDNQRLTPESLYRSHRYWELNGKPKSFAEAIGKGMFNYDTSDHGWHANSVTFNENTGEYEFMKPNWHSTKMCEDAWYYSEDGEEFRKNYIKKPGVAYDKYIPRHADGKLPRYKDGYKYSWNEDTQSWDRYTGDAMGDVFADFVVTPRGGARRKDVEPVQIVTPEQEYYSQRNKPTVQSSSTWSNIPAASTFAGRMMQAIGGDWKSADIASSGMSLHPLLSIPIGIMDTGYNLNQSLHNITDENKHIDTALSAASVLPFVGGFKLLKGKDFGTKMLNAYNNYMHSIGNADDINKSLQRIRYLDSATDAAPAVIGKIGAAIDNPFKSPIDKTYLELFNDMKRMQIREALSQTRSAGTSGVDIARDPYSIRNLSRDVIHHEGMPDEVEDIFRHQILPRTNINPLNYDSTIDVLKRYGYNTLDDYNWNKYVDTNIKGYLDNNTLAIAMPDGYVRNAAPHEFRHRMLSLVPYRPHPSIDRNAYLNRAYDDDFVNLPNTVEEGDHLRGYKNMEDEKATTNLDARSYAFENFTDNPNIGKLSVTEQNKFLDSLSDDLIIEAVERSNGYGRRFISFLNKKYDLSNNPKVKALRANYFRDAMKYYGVAAIPTAMVTSTMLKQEQ